MMESREAVLNNKNARAVISFQRSEEFQKKILPNKKSPRRRAFFISI